MTMDDASLARNLHDEILRGEDDNGIAPGHAGEYHFRREAGIGGKTKMLKWGSVMWLLEEQKPSVKSSVRGLNRVKPNCARLY
jgi:hypothetical protein